MGIRTLLRIGLLVFAAAIGLLVWAQWRPEVERTAAPVEGPRLNLPEGEREVRSTSDELMVSQSVDGREFLRISARRELDYEDGWNVYEGPEVIIFGREVDSSDDDVTIRGDTMRTAGDIGAFTEVRVIGNVEATLPGGGSFTTRRIDYDAVTGEASNCNRNTLDYAGLLVRSDCIAFQTSGDPTGGEELAAESLRMWGDLDLAAAEEGTGLPPGLGGKAAELSFRPGGDRVRLEGNASLDFTDVVTRGQLLELEVGDSIRELRGVIASGVATVRIGSGRGARILSGDEIAIGLSDETVESVDAAGAPARLQIQGRGAFEAPRVQLRVAGATMEIVGSGGSEWLAADTEGGVVDGLRAEDVRLGLVDGEFESLSGSGGVEIEGGDERGARFAGPAVEMAWANGAITRAEWPDGMEMVADDRRLAAGKAKLTDGDWVLGGTPRPQVEIGGSVLEAAAIELDPEGAVTAKGEVTGALSGDRLASGGALFGDAARVQTRSTEATLAASGETTLEGDVQLVWGSQSLVTDELRLETAPGRLRALRNVELVAAIDRAAETPELVTLSAQNLLVEQDSGEILAGTATMRQGDRTIKAQRMTVALDESGVWSTIAAAGNVEFQEPDISAGGDRLEYDMASRELLLLASPEVPARFLYGDLEYRSTEALRVFWQGEDVVIEATEAGRTTTKVVRGDTGSP